MQAPPRAPSPAPGEDSAPVAEPRRSRWPTVVSSLESADFRWLIGSIIAGNTANWMEIIVRSLIVYDISGSALMLGVVNGAKSVPMIFVGFLGGVLADRMDRRTLLTTSQLATGAIAIALAVLLVTGNIEVWHFVVASLLGGAISAIQQPARQAMVPSVVPREYLMNAVALSGSVWNVSRMVGPALAGIAAAIAGPAAALFLEGGLYAVGAVGVQQVRFRDPLAMGADPSTRAKGAGHRGGGRRGGGSWLDSFRGYAYLKENPVVGWLAVLGLVPIFFSIANQALAPVFAKEVLHIGAGGVGLLLAAPGIGSILATFIIASAGDLPRKGLLILGGVVLLGFATLAYGLSSITWLSLAMLVVHGFAMTGFRSINQTVVQLSTPDEYRGRVMAVYAADRGLQPISTLAITFATDMWSAPIAVALSGLCCIVVALVVGAASRTLRELD